MVVTEHHLLFEKTLVAYDVVLLEQDAHVVRQRWILLAKRRQPLCTFVFCQLQRLVQPKACRTPAFGIHPGHVRG